MTTLKEVFAVSPDSIQNSSMEKWNNIKERLDKEIKGIKWLKVTSDLIKNVGELLNIRIPDLFIASWKKGNAIQDALLESKQTPEKTIEIGLAEHTIESEYHPFIEIRINSIPQPKKINFKIQVSFDLKGFILKIRNGSIYEIQPGSCEITGILECENILLAEKKSEPIKLPGSFAVTI